MAKADIGLIGLAVMGENLALNIERNGFSLAVYNRTAERTRRFLSERGEGKNIQGAYSVEELVNSLSSPRKIIMMVKAGEPVDQMLAQLRPHLAPGDIIMDGGNSFFRDTERRSREMTTLGFNYFGVGISGGEEGALNGPSIMPGGPKEAYSQIEPILTSIAAQVDDGPCCTYIGPGGAGHFVKMAHNGCEYGIMQAIAEIYDLFSRGVGMPAEEIGDTFALWNETELGSYLVEITAKVLRRLDPDTGGPLVDIILDKAGQKGTGKWTSQGALDLGVPLPTIDAAMTARNISAYKSERVAANLILHGPTEHPKIDKVAVIEAARRALYATTIAAYAQTMALLTAASAEYGYNLDLSEIARIWKGGCIIRAKFLDLVQESFQSSEEGEGSDLKLANLMVDPVIASDLNRLQSGWRMVILTMRTLGLPCPAISASLDYFDSYRHERLPANLLQGLRDFFGAHTYERIDKPGIFHTEWMEKSQS